MTGRSIYEFDTLAIARGGEPELVGMHWIPANVFSWLEDQCLRSGDGTGYLRLAQRGGRRVVQVTNYVGVIQAPNGYQIEVLPKVGKYLEGGASRARQLLIDMLCCLNGFRHVQTESAMIAATRMPLLEVFIAEFLRAVEHVVKRGLRNSYSVHRENMFALRGKLQIATHLRENICRADRFFVEYDEFSSNRPENRLLHAALRWVLTSSTSQSSQQLARELTFVFAEVPVSADSAADFQKVQLDRGMQRYADALAWARLILEKQSPLTGSGKHRAPSLLFPMEMLFEAFVAKHLARRLIRPKSLRTQVRSHHLVRHGDQSWFQLRPDLVIREGGKDLLVLDTKWKSLDRSRSNATEKYGLSQSDFYQLQSYGLSYLDGSGDIVLIYPRTDSFDQPLSPFTFPKAEGMRLWVLPFCLKEKRLLVAADASFGSWFNDDSGASNEATSA